MRNNQPVVTLKVEALARLFETGRLDILDAGKRPVLTLTLPESPEAQFIRWLLSPDGRARLAQHVTPIGDPS
jgi:hypothetical protein